MPSFTLKNIPDELYEQLKSTAELHHRSINSEILAYLERTLGARPTPAEIVASARRLRQAVGGDPITIEELEQTRVAGRP